MENYGNVTLTVNVERVELTAETKHQVAKNELTAVPAGLTGTSFNTLEKIKAEQNRVLTQLLGENPKDNVIHYDMKLQFSTDGGNSWVDATHENFPEEGVTVTLPYPSGTGRYTHNFAVSHMFTAGDNPGTVETPEVKNTDSGIEFTLFADDTHNEFRGIILRLINSRIRDRDHQAVRKSIVLIGKCDIAEVRRQLLHMVIEMREPVKADDRSQYRRDYDPEIALSLKSRSFKEENYESYAHGNEHTDEEGLH
jgi:hypothetical protein